MLLYVLCVSITEKPAGSVHRGASPHGLSGRFYLQAHVEMMRWGPEDLRRGSFPGRRGQK